MPNFPVLSTFVIATSIATVSYATSCGEPRRSASDTCSDWQCSRIIYPSAPSVGAGAPPAASPQHLIKGSDNTNDGNGTYFGFGLCVRGLGEGSPCFIDDDCFSQKYSCQNVSITVTGLNGTSSTQWSNKCAKKGSTTSAWQGYVAVLVAVLGFGTNFVPAKQVRAGNGMLFQLAQAMGVLFVGIAVALATHNYTIYPMSLLGGLLWAVGNCLCVPVIQLVGLGIGLSVWGTASMLFGWASGRFGLMGVEQETVPTPWRSYIGVGVAVFAICAFAAVKPSSPKKKDIDEDIESNASLLNSVPIDHQLNIASKADHIYAVDEDIRRQQEQTDKAKSPNTRRATGLILGLIAGVFFGLNFNPSQALMDHYDDNTLEDSSSTPGIHYTPDGIDYFFSVTLGIAMTSISLTALFYAAHNFLPKSVAKKVLPTLLDDMHLLNFGDMVVPGIVSGIIWAIAQSAWFVANTNLGLAVSFPLVSIGPSIVANLWGIFLFKEIEGRRNFMLLALAFGLVGLSCGFTVWAQQS